MKPQALTPFILFSLTVTLPACQGGDPGSAGASYAAQVAPPAACGNGDPTCNTALDYPTQADLTIENSQNIEFATGTNQIQLEPGSGLIIDTDGDGVPDPADECPGPGWRLPCDGDPGNEGSIKRSSSKRTRRRPCRPTWRSPDRFRAPMPIS